MKAVIYARVSTGEQAKQELSIPDQLNQCRAYCDAKDWVVVGEYIDPGYSATTENRPDYQRMLRDAKRTPKPFDMIIVHSQSRFARDLTDLLYNERTLTRAGIKIVSITQDFGDSDAAPMMRTVVGMMDEHHSRETSKHVKRSMAENARQGFWSGSRPPLGYVTYTAEMRGKKEKKKLKEDPSEAEIIRLIFALYTEGEDSTGPLGVNAIAAELNARRLTNRGKPFSKQTIAKLLRNETYTGTFFFGKKSGKPPSAWISVPVPPIIDRLTFDAAQRRLDRQHPFKTPPRRSNNPVLLSGLAVCDACGKPMRLATGKSGAYRYYKCSQRMEKGSTICTGCSIPESLLDTEVLEAFVDRVLDTDRLSAIVPALIMRAQEKNSDTNARIRQLKNQRSGIKNKQKRLITLLEDSAIEADQDVKERLTEHRQAIDEIDQQILRLEITQERSIVEINDGTIARFSQSLRSRLTTNKEPAFRKSYLQLFIDEVRACKTTITIKGKNQRLAAATIAEATNQNVLSFAQEWCPEEDQARGKQSQKPFGFIEVLN